MNRPEIDPVERTVSAALESLRLGSGDRILIALSGGADSVALTYALRRLQDRFGYGLTGAHLNHRLRAVESDRDERFVRDLCERLRIELVVESAEGINALSNLEESARVLRYAFLNRTANRVGARHIAVAHHAGDQAETVMLRLLRGTGAAGLAAMSAIGPGRIVRPLLTLRRQEILAYLDALAATYVCDSSNLSPTILRNRVRHELLPMLEGNYSPRLSRRLTELAGEMRALDDYISGEGRRELHQRLLAPDHLDLTGFADLHPALSNAMIREWLRERFGGLRRVYRAEIDRLSRFCAAAAPGSTARLARGWRLRCKYGSAVIEPFPALEATPFALELAREGVTEALAAGFTFEARILALPGREVGCEARIACAWQMEALFDADRLEGGLLVRSFRHGDRIRPLGMHGSRKVQDVFVDRKVPRERRTAWPIVEGAGEILWIPGVSRSRIALINQATQRLLHFTAKPRANMENTSLLRN